MNYNLQALPTILGNPFAIVNGQIPLNGPSTQRTVPNKGLVENRPLNNVFGGMAPPQRKDFATEKQWLYESVRYFAFKSYMRMAFRNAQSQLGTELYAKYVNGTGIGTDLPTSINFYANEIFSIINKLTGEYAGSNLKAVSRVTNRDAVWRKVEAKADLYLDDFVRTQAPELAKHVENPLPNSEAIQSEIGDIDLSEHFENIYRDNYALFGEHIFRSWAQQNDFKEWAIQTYKLFLLTDEAHCFPQVDINNMRIVNNVIHPAYTMSDISCRDDFFKNSKYFIEYFWVSIPEARRMFPDISLKDLENPEYRSTTAFIPGMLLRRQIPNSSTYEVLVLHCTFISADIDAVTVGDTNEQILSFNEATKEWEVNWEVSTKKRKQVGETTYDVWIVGNEIADISGKAHYRLFSVDTPAIVKLPAVNYIYDFSISPNIPSSMQRIKAIVEQINHLWFKITERIKKSYGPVMQILVNELSNYDFASDDNSGGDKDEQQRASRIVHNVLNSFRTGILLSKESSGPFAAQLDSQGRSNLIQSIDMDGNLINFMTAMFTNIEALKKLMQEILSMNEPRLGQGNPYQTATTAQIQKTQSEYGTAQKRIGFDTFISKSATLITNYLVFMNVEKKKIYQLNGNKDMFDRESYRYGQYPNEVPEGAIMQDYETEIVVETNSSEALAKIEMQLNQYASHSPSPQLMAIILSLATDRDVSAAKNRFEKLVRIEAEQRKQEQQMQMQQMQMQMQQAQQAVQMQAQQKEADRQNKLDIQNMKNVGMSDLQQLINDGKITTEEQKQIYQIIGAAVARKSTPSTS